MYGLYLARPGISYPTTLGPAACFKAYELQSKLLVSPLITPIVVPYRIPYITPLRSLDYSSYGSGWFMPGSALIRASLGLLAFEILSDAFRASFSKSRKENVPSKYPNSQGEGHFTKLCFATPERIPPSFFS